jgi:hypothetical protein
VHLTSSSSSRQPLASATADPSSIAGPAGRVLTWLENKERKRRGRGKCEAAEER